MRIPDYTEVRGNWDATRFAPEQMTVGEHLDQVRERFVEENQKRFLNTRSALEFVQQELPYLPALDQAAVAKQLIEDTDRTVRWPSFDRSSTRLKPEHQRQRQEIILRTVTEFVDAQRGPTLGVADLAKSLGLKRASPGGLPREGATMVGDHFVTSIQIPSVSLHDAASPGTITTPRAEIRREGDELAFTAWVPNHDGYLQIMTRIAAEKSEGPLSPRERAATTLLSESLSQAFGDLLPTMHIGKIGSERAGDGVISRPFDQRRALENGTYVSVPLGEGQVHRSRDHGQPGHSAFSVGPVTFSVMHGIKSPPLDHPLSNGRSFRLYQQPNGTSVQMLFPLANGDSVYATLAPQKTRAEAEGQLVALNELAHKVFA